jgi:hypothetical protein
MSWTEVFGDRISRIRISAGEMLSHATMLANFRQHRPAWGYYEILATARDLRSAADELDKLAKKMKGRASDYTDKAA